jgi:protein-S-isoprenylcysteine O-methyltransferase Ste14
MNLKEIIRNWPLSLAGIILVPYFLFYWVPGKILGASLCCLIPGVGLLAIPGLLLIIPGLAVFVWSVMGLVIRGRGTPAPVVHPKKLVVTGLYRHVRNPMYLGFLAVIAGEAIMFRSWDLFSYLAAMFALSFFVILTLEEPLLKHKFGDAYEEYRGSVPRWIPRLKPKKGM